METKHSRNATQGEDLNKSLELLNLLLPPEEQKLSSDDANKPLGHSDALRRYKEFWKNYRINQLGNKPLDISIFSELYTACQHLLMAALLGNSEAQDITGYSRNLLGHEFHQACLNRFFAELGKLNPQFYSETIKINIFFIRFYLRRYTTVYSDYNVRLQELSSALQELSKLRNNQIHPFIKKLLKDILPRHPYNLDDNAIRFAAEKMLMMELMGMDPLLTIVKTYVPVQAQKRLPQNIYPFRLFSLTELEVRLYQACDDKSKERNTAARNIIKFTEAALTRFTCEPIRANHYYLEITIEQLRELPAPICFIDKTSGIEIGRFIFSGNQIRFTAYGSSIHIKIAGILDVSSFIIENTDGNVTLSANWVSESPVYLGATVERLNYAGSICAPQRKIDVRWRIKFYLNEHFIEIPSGKASPSKSPNPELKSDIGQQYLLSNSELKKLALDEKLYFQLVKAMESWPAISELVKIANVDNKEPDKSIKNLILNLLMLIKNGKLKLEDVKDIPRKFPDSLILQIAFNQDWTEWVSYLQDKTVLELINADNGELIIDFRLFILAERLNTPSLLNNKGFLDSLRAQSLSTLIYYKESYSEKRTHLLLEYFNQNDLLGEYLNNVQNHLMKPIQDKIDLLIANKDPISSAKVEQLQQFQLDFLNNLSQYLCNLAINNNNAQYNIAFKIASLNKFVFNFVEQYANKPIINTRNNKDCNFIKAILKGVLGVFLGALSGGLAFCSTQFRCHFFYTGTYRTLNESMRKLQASSDRLVARYRS